jgi:SAM-dependent methyltransferase
MVMLIGPSGSIVAAGRKETAGGGHSDGLKSLESKGLSAGEAGVTEGGGVVTDKYYDNGYHRVVHWVLIENDEYYLARARYGAEFYFKGIPQDARVLEYGCGVGQNIAGLKNAVGVDISAEARETARQHGVKVYASSQELASESFDIVFCRHCLEHLENPAGDLSEMRRLLKPGGRLRLVLPKEGHRRVSLTPDIHQHLYCWNFRSINNLLNRCGFRPTSNKVNYMLGFRRLLPVKRVFGLRVCVAAARFVHFMLGTGELIVDAERRR